MVPFRINKFTALVVVKFKISKKLALFAFTIQLFQLVLSMQFLIIYPEIERY